MLKRFIDWLNASPPPAVLALCVFAFVAGAVVCAGCASAPLTPNHVETELCQARAAWKVVAIGAGGTLDPVPGSERAKLEAAEDALCALVPVTLPDGGK